ncbi:MAG: VOC family protein [Geminicoccaceae bacterium]|nr:VOC family protein [Geminicoccaceae bacterium]
MDLLVNIDVPDIEAGLAFYTEGLGFVLGRRFGEGFVELTGASSRVYLLANPPGSVPAPGAAPRAYARHWTPLHLDVVVDDLDAALARAEAAGAVREKEPRAAPYGRIVLMADPFGNGFCLIEFNGQGYDAIAQDG